MHKEEVDQEIQVDQEVLLRKDVSLVVKRIIIDTIAQPKCSVTQARCPTTPTPCVGRRSPRGGLGHSPGTKGRQTSRRAARRRKM